MCKWWKWTTFLCDHSTHGYRENFLWIAASSDLVQPRIRSDPHKMPYTSNRHHLHTVVAATSNGNGYVHSNGTTPSAFMTSKCLVKRLKISPSQWFIVYLVNKATRAGPVLPNNSSKSFLLDTAIPQRPAGLLDWTHCFRSILTNVTTLADSQHWP